MVVRMTKRLVIPNACEESRIIAALMGDSSLHAVPFRMTVPFEEKVIMTIMSFRGRPVGRRGISAVILNVGEISKFYCSVPNDNCFILNGKEASPLSKYLKRDSSLVGIGMAGT